MSDVLLGFLIMEVGNVGLAGGSLLASILKSLREVLGDESVGSHSHKSHEKGNVGHGVHICCLASMLLIFTASSVLLPQHRLSHGVPRCHLASMLLISTASFPVLGPTHV